jgi:hypothetical protein
MPERRGACRIFVGKPKEKRPSGRPRCRPENNIIMNYLEVGWGIGWIDLAQDRDMCRALVYAVMNLRIPPNAGNFFTSRRRVGFLRKTLLYRVSYYNFNVHTYSFH